VRVLCVTDEETGLVREADSTFHQSANEDLTKEGSKFSLKMFINGSWQLLYLYLCYLRP
jgi:hypothetical protein